MGLAMRMGSKEGSFRLFLRLEHGIPSHDPFSRVFRCLDPEQFRTFFVTFMARLAGQSKARSPSTLRRQPRRCTRSAPGAAKHG